MRVTAKFKAYKPTRPIFEWYDGKVEVTIPSVFGFTLSGVKNKKDLDQILRDKLSEEDLILYSAEYERD